MVGRLIEYTATGSHETVISVVAANRGLESQGKVPSIKLPRVNNSRDVQPQSR